MNARTGGAAPGGMGPGGRQTGQILVVATLALLALVGFLALVLDMGHFLHHRRAMQTAADAAALAAAVEIERGAPEAGAPVIREAALRGARDNGFEHAREGVRVDVLQPPPASGAGDFYAGDTRFVEVRLSQPSPLWFARALFALQGAPTPRAVMQARAVAGVFRSSGPCLLLLAPAQPALTLDSGARLDTDCALQVNAEDDCAIDLAPGSRLSAAAIAVSGGYCAAGGAAAQPEPQTDAPPLADPLQALARPAGLVLRSAERLSVVADQRLSPGVYRGGVEVTRGVTLRLEPGLYVIEGGGLRVSGRLEGEGVMIYNSAGPGLPYAPIGLEAQAEAVLRAPASGAYAGVLLVQDREVASPVNAAGGIGDGLVLESKRDPVLDGALYFPSQRVRLARAATLDLSRRLIAHSLSLDNGSRLGLSQPPDPGPALTRRVTLVD